jgi:hypothetical protein
MYCIWRFTCRFHSCVESNAIVNVSHSISWGTRVPELGRLSLGYMLRLLALEMIVHYSRGSRRWGWGYGLNVYPIDASNWRNNLPLTI